MPSIRGCRKIPGSARQGREFWTLVMDVKDIPDLVVERALFACIEEDALVYCERISSLPRLSFGSLSNSSSVRP